MKKLILIVAGLAITPFVLGAASCGTIPPGFPF